MSGLNIGLSLIFPLITLPYVSKVLGVENIGKYNFSNTFCSYFVLLAALGVNTYGIRECSKVRNDREKASDFVSQIFTINMLTTLAAYILLFTVLAVTDSLKPYRSCILVFSVTLFFTTLGIEWVYKAYEQFSYITVRNAVFKIIALFLLFIFVKKEEDYVIYALITVVSTSGAYILNYIHSNHYCKVRLTRSIQWKIHFKPLVLLSASALAVHIYNSSDTLMLGLLTNDYYVGIYTTSSRIYLMAKSILLAILSVAIPELSVLVTDKNHFEYLVKKIINAMNFFALPLMIGIICLSDQIINILAGTAYAGAASSLKILSIAIICSMYAWIASECVLIPAKREKDSLISTGIAAMINIGLNFIFIPLWNANAAAVTTCIAECFVMVYCTIKADKVTSVSFINRETFKVLAGCSGVVFVCVLVRFFIKGFVMQTVVAVTGSVLVYFLINLILRNEICILVRTLIGRLI